MCWTKLIVWLINITSVILYDISSVKRELNANNVFVFVFVFYFLLLKLLSVFAELARSEVEQVTKTLHAEFDVERRHHQKMLNDHARLQQRLENLQNSVNLQLPISSVSNHVSRSPSNVSNLSSESESTSDKNEQVSFSLIIL